MIIDKEKKIVRINVHASNMIIYKKSLYTQYYAKIFLCIKF